MTDVQTDLDLQEEERLAFAEELEEVALQLALQNPDLAAAERAQQIAAEYERLAMAAEMFVLPDVSALIDWSQASLDSAALPTLLDAGKYFTWLELTALTFREPEEVSHLPMLMAELADPLWPEALPAEQLQAFLLSLRPALPAGAEGMVSPSEAAASDLVQTLAFAEDVHPELLAAYREETPGHVAEVARLIRALADGGCDEAQRKQAARLAHTVKGSSSVVGAQVLAEFTHRLEDVLEFPLAQIAAQPDLGATLVASADCLEALFENLQAGAGLPENYTELQQQLAHALTGLAAEYAAQPLDEAATTLPKLNASELPAFLQARADLEGDVEATTEAATLAPKAATLPALAQVGEDRVQAMLRLTGELITSTSLTAEALQQTRTLGMQLYRQDDQVRQRLDELDSLVDQQRRNLRALNPVAGTATAVGVPAEQVDADELEIESYSDLYSTTNLLTEAAADSHEMAQELQNNIRQLSDALYQQQRVQRQLSQAVLGLRLTPVSELVPRLERIVRETCRKTGKQVAIEIEGQELQADTDIVKGLAEPLLHLLRNAVDHGIEMPDVRAALNKPEQGSIRLRFSQAGNNVNLAIADDGAGMEPQHIRQRALARGLLREDEALSDEALLRLILLPGFSTRDAVSEVSGRGVGMDVVQSALEKLRGRLRISSTPGEGTTFNLTLPQTLIATHALIVRVGGHYLAIPADSVEQLLYVSAAESTIDEQGWRITTERYQLPVLKLSDLLHWRGEPVTADSSHTLLVVRSELNTYALYAEEILPSRDIVINSLAPWITRIPSVQGACILANGGVAAVMDMMRLLHELEEGALTPQASQAASMPQRQRQTLLVVDDSLSNRKSMRLLLEPMGYRVETAVDGMDALELMNNIAVDLVLTDLEMPRMNGLETTQAIRIWPEMKHLPIVMITSRGTQKHRQLAAEAGVDGYLTKPVQSDALQREVQKWLGTQMASDSVRVVSRLTHDSGDTFGQGARIDG